MTEYQLANVGTKKEQHKMATKPRTGWDEPHQKLLIPSQEIEDSTELYIADLERRNEDALRPIYQESAGQKLQRMEEQEFKREYAYFLTHQGRTLERQIEEDENYLEEIY